MYQPEGFPAPMPESDLEAFTVPTAKETTDAPAKPGRVCPDKPDRECMLRYLYAQKHHHNVKCATCGQVSAKVSSMRRGQKRRASLETTALKTEEYRRSKKLEYSRRQEEKRKIKRQERIAAMTPEEIEAKRQKQLESLAKGRETQRRNSEAKKAALAAKAVAMAPEEAEQKLASQEKRLARQKRSNEAKRSAREMAKAAKLAVMTPEEIRARDEALRQVRMANLAKAQAANKARRDQDVAAKQRRHEKFLARMEAKKLRERAKAPARRADRMDAAKASLELVRLGKKPASRCEAVVLAISWMLDAGLKDVSMLDFMGAVNKYMHKKVANSGALGRSVRDYELTVKTEYRGPGNARAFLYLDDKARAFVAGGWLKSLHGVGRNFKEATRD